MKPLHPPHAVKQEMHDILRHEIQQQEGEEKLRPDGKLHQVEQPDSVFDDPREHPNARDGKRGIDGQRSAQEHEVDAGVTPLVVGKPEQRLGVLEKPACGQADEDSYRFLPRGHRREKPQEFGHA